MVKKVPGYPFESRYWDRRGLKYHYLDEGRGEPVVMVHGNPSWSFYYRGLVNSLRGAYRVIVPDHIGCGLSEKPDDKRYDYSLKSRVDDLEALLEKLGVRENITLVVHDWGGAIGLSYACRKPDRVKRLILLNTAAFLLPLGKPFPWILSFCRTTLGAFLVRGLNAFSLGATFFCCRSMSGDVRRAYLAPYDSWQNRISILRFIENIPDKPGHRSYEGIHWLDSQLERFKGLPILIAWGGKDFIFDQDYLREWTRRFPQAEVRLFPQAGHYILEDCGPEVANLALNFLRKNPLPSPA